MEEVVVAGLVGAGLGYVVRFSQEQIQRAVRGWPATNWWQARPGGGATSL